MLSLRFAIALTLTLVASASIAACSSDPDVAPTAPAAADAGPPDAPDAPAPSHCDGGLICDAVCVDTTTDDANCGGCGQSCSGGAACRGGACRTGTGFLFRQIFLGESLRDGTSSATAWRDYGDDIDGITSTVEDNGECIPRAGASAQSRVDGEGGIDNAWGKSIIPFLQPFAATPSKSVNDLVEAGAGAPMLHLTTWTGGDASGLDVGFLAATNTFAPSWDGLDVRGVRAASMNGAEPRTRFTDASIAAGAFLSGPVQQTALLSLPVGFGVLSLEITKVHVRMTLSGDGKSATGGVLSGVIEAEGLADALVAAFTAMSPSLCDGSTAESIRQSVLQAADIMADGTQDPTKECDGISIGLGFEAAAVVVGDVGPPEPAPKDPCE
jgi:hypothetical protein